MAIIAEYNSNLHYIQGDDNIVADCFSRPSAAAVFKYYEAVDMI